MRKKGIGLWPSLRLLSVSAAAIALSACTTGNALQLSMGNSDAVKRANELAISCNLPGALQALEEAEASGGLASNVSQLQRVVFLRDAQRTAEANTALAAWNDATNATASDAAKTESSIQESLVELQAERRSRTGSASC
ncbi:MULTISPECIES: hypothetical protein [unclassified Ruegeria]|uniref:hypothetical protein n=1 Tax=unclassified Ruegeria TaxID=2625375 RepID=UPI0014894807|nr:MULTISPECIES: hypothetical protein [unclassified Ruegeria]